MSWIVGDSSQTFEEASQDYTNLSSDPGHNVPSTFFWMSKLQDTEMSAFITEWMSKDPAAFGASPEAFFNAFYDGLQSQTWWTDHTANYRAAKEIELTDPGTWAEMISVNEADAAKYASDLGVSLSDTQIEELALNMAYQQWTDTEIEQSILQTTYYDQQGSAALPVSGSIKDLYDSIKGVASNNLVTVSDDWAWRMAYDIKSERVTSSQVSDSLFDLVDTQYSFIGTEKLGKWRTSDTTLSDQLSPVLQAVKNTWGVEDIDLQSDWFKDNLIVRGDDNVERFASTAEAKALAMKDDRYKKTSAHINNMQEFTTGMSKMFGVY